jgi:hypothetical protein
MVKELPVFSPLPGRLSGDYRYLTALRVTRVRLRTKRGLFLMGLISHEVRSGKSLLRLFGRRENRWAVERMDLRRIG